MACHRPLTGARAFFAICALLALLPSGTARSSGINLAWDDCGGAGAAVQSFACNTTEGAPFSLVASFVPPAGVAALIGVSGDLRISGPLLPDWWKHGFEQCRGGSGLFPDVAFEPGACATPWTGSQTSTITYRQDPRDPNTAYVTVQILIPDGEAVTVSPASEYHAFTLRVARTQSVGLEACSGCADAVRILLERIELHQAKGAGENPTLENPLASTTAYWQTEVGGAPQITSLTPDAGGPGTSVDIAGAHLTGAWSVRFGTAEAAFTVQSDQLIRATVPATAPTDAVEVHTPFGIASSAEVFRVPPVVIDFVPRQSTVGSAVMVRGLNFGSATGVEFNGVSASFNVQSESVIRATVPDGAVEGPIRVTGPNGVGISAQTFRLGPPEGLLNLSWDDCGLSGTDLETFSCISNPGPFNLIASFVPPPGIDQLLGVIATIRVASDALPNWWTYPAPSCRVLCPTTDFQGRDACTDPWADGGAYSLQTMELDYYGPGTARLRLSAYRTIGAIDPASEYYAFRVPVTTHHNVMEACGAIQDPIDFTLDEIQMVLPEGVLSAIHEPLTRATARWEGQAGQAPRVDAFSPSAGAPGSSVSIAGGNFSGASSVRLGAQEAAFKVISDTEISATVPADALTGPIRVTGPFGADVTEASFIVAPRILSFTPRQAPVGATVWVTGENFGDVTEVTFHDDVAADFVIMTDTELRASVPASVVDGAIVVRNDGGASASKLSFRAGAGSVPDINLSWDDCGEAGIDLYTFACDVNSGPPFALVASFVPPAGVAEFLGVSATLMVESESEILPNWWEHGIGYCRGTSRLSTAFDFRTGPYTCRDVFQGLGAGGYDYEAHWDKPNLARIRIQGAVPYENRLAVDPSDEYYAFKVHILRSRTHGEGACDGCGTPVRVWLNEIQLFQPAGRNHDPVIAAVDDGSNEVFWQATKTTTPVLVSVVSAEATTDRVRLIWQTEDVERARVHRREGSAEWLKVADLLPDGEHRVRYEDTDVTPGALYEYRLGIASPAGEVYLGETQVLIPTLASTPLSLARVAWNGSALAVSLSLPRAGTAAFELFDVHGRRLMSESIEGLEAGSHDLQLRPRHSLKPGVLFARLIQDGYAVRRRFVVVE